MYSVSVGSIREALSMLITAGLIETRAGSGTYVARIDTPSDGAGQRTLERKEVEELIEAREVIESRLAALAAERATPERIAELRGRLEMMEAVSSDPVAYAGADVEFHLALARAAGNRFLLRAMTDIRSILKRDMELAGETAIRRFGHMQFSVDSHRLLVEAIEEGDSQAASTVISAIVKRNRAFVLGLYALVEPLPATTAQRES
jgi:GntR family transcriptional repressor for pyruvate dehydrogenase complex